MTVKVRLPRGTANIAKELLREKGKDYSLSMIRAVMNGKRSNIFIEEALLIALARHLAHKKRIQRLKHHKQ